jgi:hypothetical protein
MTAIRFFTDEDLYGAIAPALRNRGLDAVSTPEAGRLGAFDEDQLVWAATAGRVLVTFNVGHFAALHALWLGAGKHHAGVIVSAQLDLGDVLKRLVHLASSLDADSMVDRLEFLSDW